MLSYALLCMFYCINGGLTPINSWGLIKLLTYRRFWILLVVDLQCPKAPADGGCLAWANATCTNITGKPEIGCKDGTICCDLSPPNCQDEYQYCVKPVPMHEFPGKYLAISRPQAYLRSISKALVRTVIFLSYVGSQGIDAKQPLSVLCFRTWRFNKMLLMSTILGW